MGDVVDQVGTVTVQQVRVPMRDGVRLAAVLHGPAGTPRPVILIRTPYAEPLSRTFPITPALAAGFSVLVQSCRGAGLSEGRPIRTFENERADGLDSIAWLREQPWCTGQVCMIGGSYLGMVQLAVCGHTPEGLVAISPTVTPDGYRDGLAYRQGAFTLGQALGWHLLRGAMSIGEDAERGEDVTAAAAALGALAADPLAAYSALPLSDRPAIDALLPSWQTWLGRENDPAYWHGISYAGERTASTVPALHIGGWFDLFLRGTLDNYATMTGAGRGDQHLVIGPWPHADQTGITGEFNYPGGGAQLIGLEQQQLRFLRESVDDAPTSLPPVQIYVMGADRWRTENEWPLARTDWQDWFLGADGSLRRADAPAGTAGYRHDPRDPVPTIGGAILMVGSPDGGLAWQPGSRDQRALDGRSDILRFAGDVLAEDVEVTGPLQVRLFAATSVVDTDFTAKLIDVHPDGRAMAVADGIVRARYRDGMDEPQPVTPGEVYEYRIDLGATSQVFKAGHRIRIDVASSNFPCYDRNSGTGKPAGEVTDADLLPADQRVLFGPDHPSSVRLPVIAPAS